MAERTSKLKLSQFTTAEEDSTLFQTWSRNLNSPQGNNDLKKIDDFAADVLDVKLPEKADKPKGTELTDLEGKVPVFDADGNLHNSTVSIGSTIEAGGNALIKANVLKQRFSEMDAQKADKEYVDRAIASVAETAVTTANEAKADAETAVTTANEAKASGKAVAEAVASKADKTEVNKLNGDLANLKSYEYTIKNGYIDYVYGVENNSSMTKIVTFNVFENLTIIWKYKQSNPDVRAIAFYDLCGNLLKTYQVSTEEQEIVIPHNAKTCKATVTDANQIIIKNFNALLSEIDKPLVENVTETLLNGWANYIDCVIVDSEYSKYVKFSVTGGQKFEYTTVFKNTSLYGLFFADENNLPISGSGVQTLTEPQIVTVPQNAKYCYATVNAITDIAFINDEMIYPIMTDISKSKLSPFVASDNPLDNVLNDVGYTDLFLTVGCIGDSLASGESYWNDTTPAGKKDFYEYSWGQFLARKTGNTYYNWSVGGFTTKTWLASDKATECFDGEHKCTAYIIGLGQNDSNVNMTIGTSTDIHIDDYSLNADTFYGNYGKIIQKIKEVQPQAKIFIITDPAKAVENRGYNTAIRTISTLFTNVYLIDMYTYGNKFLNHPILKAQARAGHYSAYGYYIFALLIGNYIDWIVKTRYTEFTTIELIGTGHSYT